MTSNDYGVRETERLKAKAGSFFVLSWFFVIIGFLCLIGLGEKFYFPLSINQGIGFILVGLFFLMVVIVHIGQVWLSILTLTIEASNETQTENVLEQIKSLGSGLD